MLMNTYLGRLVYDVKVDTVGDAEKTVLNNRIAIPMGKDKATFVDIVAWGKNAEFINSYFKKGNEILIQGYLVNKIGKKEEVEFNTVMLQVERINFTYGNNKPVQQEIN
ncbi:MAG: single-stranded DNA-binding protein [Peptostreptococcales bacterium]